jgi:hypothetical protein
MANTLKFGNGNWATKEGSTLAYNDENNNFKPLPFNFERDSRATVVNRDGLIETVGNNIPRIDYKDNSEGTLLLEPSRANLVTYSSDLSVLSKVSVGTASNPVTTANYALAPDGTMTATRVVFDLNGGTTNQDRSILRQSISSGDYYLSIYVKSTDGTEQKVMWHDGSEFDVTTVTNEWKRITYDSRSGVSNVGIALTGLAGVDTSDILVWGFQAEAGSYATSYIPTSGSAVTRLADSCSQTVPDGVIGQTEGVLYAEIKANETSDVSDRRTISLSDGTNSNRIYISFDDEYNKLNILIIVGGTTVTASNVDISNQNTYNKVAVRYNSGDSAIYVNGVLKNSFNDTFSSGVFNALKFQNRGSGEFFYGNVKDVRVYNTALTDLELKALTS